MTEDIEKLRSDYRPVRVKVLFVGESPPKKNFFYCKRGPLYNAIEETFIEVFGKQQEFLEFFMDKGFWLTDFFKERGKKCATDKEIEEGIEILSKLIRENRKDIKFVITIIKRIADHVKEAVKCSDVEITFRYLPFPMGKHKKFFIQKLKKTLKEIEAFC